MLCGILALLCLEHWEFLSWCPLRCNVPHRGNSASTDLDLTAQAREREGKNVLLYGLDEWNMVYFMALNCLYKTAALEKKKRLSIRPIMFRNITDLNGCSKERLTVHRHIPAWQELALALLTKEYRWYYIMLLFDYYIHIPCCIHRSPRYFNIAL